MSVIEALRARIRQYETGGHAGKSAVLPFGVPELDGKLPDRGLRLGALHDVADGGTANAPVSQLGGGTGVNATGFERHW